MLKGLIKGTHNKPASATSLNITGPVVYPLIKWWNPGLDCLFWHAAMKGDMGSQMGMWRLRAVLAKVCISLSPTWIQPQLPSFSSNELGRLLLPFLTKVHYGLRALRTAKDLEGCHVNLPSSLLSTWRGCRRLPVRGPQGDGLRRSQVGGFREWEKPSIAGGQVGTVQGESLEELTAYITAITFFMKTFLTLQNIENVRKTQHFTQFMD